MSKTHFGLKKKQNTHTKKKNTRPALFVLTQLQYPKFALRKSKSGIVGSSGNSDSKQYLRLILDVPRRLVLTQFRVSTAHVG